MRFVLWVRGNPVYVALFSHWTILHGDAVHFTHLHLGPLSISWER